MQAKSLGWRGSLPAFCAGLLLFFSSGLFSMARELDIPADKILEVVTGQSKTIKLRTNADRINIGMRGVISVFMPDKLTVTVTGKAAGFTDILILYADGQIEQYGVRVSTAPSQVVEKLAGQIEGYMKSVPGIKVTRAEDKILLGGTVDSQYEGYIREITGMFKDIVVMQVSFTGPSDPLSQLKTYLDDIPGISIRQVEDKVVLSGEIDKKYRAFYEQVIAMFKDTVIDTVTYPGQTDVTGQLRKYFAEMPTVTIRQVEGKAVLSGVVDEPQAAYYKEVVGMFKDQIIDLVLIPSKDESIQVDVQVVEVLKENTDDLGIEWFAAGPWQISASAQGTASTNPGLGATGGSGSSSSSSSGSTSPTASASVSTGSTTSADPGGLSGSMQLNLDNVMFNLIALAQDGKARFLAKPKLLVQNGKKASFLVGGELPIPQTTAFNSTVDWKKFGTQLEISPVIQPANTVAIGLHATVSEFDFTQLVNGYPTLRSREAQTNMRTRSGDTFAIAGLLSNTENTNVEKVPILGDIPVIGYIFKRDRKKISRIETIVFFTPHILAKASAAQTEVSDTILPSQPLRKAQEELNREPDDEDDD